MQGDGWQDLHDGFVKLAEIQQQITRTTGKGFLQADCNFADPEFVPIPKGPWCEVPTLEAAILELREGPDEYLKAQLELLATRAGKSLGCPGDVSPVKVWLWNLFMHLRKTKSKYLYAPSLQVQIGDNPHSDLLKPLAGLAFYREGGTITNVCLASAIFCAWLEKKALETSASSPPVPIKKSDGRKWFKTDSETLGRRQIVLRNPEMLSESLCRVFDNSTPPIPLPRDWQAELTVTTWSEAYRNPTGRKRIQKIISTDRRAG